MKTGMQDISLSILKNYQNFYVPILFKSYYTLPVINQRAKPMHIDTYDSMVDDMKKDQN